VPRLTAEVLLCHALRQDRAWLFAHSTEELAEVVWIHYGRYLHQRLSGVPTQYITKRQEFYGRDFRVTPAVLIPRPETEHLVDAALARLKPGDCVVDIGTGSGAIAVSLALESQQSTVYATDLSAEALRVAAHNAANLNASVRFLQADFLSALAPASVDMVVSNPPYIGLDEADSLAREVRDHEPHLALFADSGGNAAYQSIVADAARVLKPGGWLLLELGHRSLDFVQSRLAADPHWSFPEVIPDLGNISRVLCVRI